MKLNQNRNVLNTPPHPAKKKCNITFFTECIQILTLDIHYQNVTLNKHSNTQLISFKVINNSLPCLYNSCHFA